jgi:hypothetical protein
VGPGSLAHGSRGSGQAPSVTARYRKGDAAEQAAHPPGAARAGGLTSRPDPLRPTEILEGPKSTASSQ